LESFAPFRLLWKTCENKGNGECMHLHMHKRKDIFPHVERTEKIETFDNLFSNEILDKLLLWDTNRHISKAICAHFFKNKTFGDKLNVTGVKFKTWMFLEYSESDGLSPI